MKPQLWRGELLRWYLKRAKHPLKAYLVGHYWNWFSRQRVWVRYDDTAVIRISLEDYLQQRIFFEGYYEQALIGWLKASLTPTDVFWDVGANVGAVTLVASRLCAQVVAFEPDPRTLSLLADNVRHNNRHNIEIVPAALGETPGAAILHQASHLNTGMSSLLTDRSSAVGQASVAVVQADQLVRNRPEVTPSVIKIDVEGAEHLVLRGARRLLATGSVRAVIFEDRRSPENQPTNQTAVECLRDAGYRIEPLGPSDAAVDDGMLNFLAVREFHELPLSA